MIVEGSGHRVELHNGQLDAKVFQTQVGNARSEAHAGGLAPAAAARHAIRSTSRSQPLALFVGLGDLDAARR